MATDYATLNLRLNNTRFNQGIKKSQKLTEGFGNSVKGIVGTIAGLYAVKQAFDFGSELVRLSAGAKEIDSKFKQVFSNMGSGADLMAKQFAKNFDIAGVTAQKLLGDTGDLLTGFGFTQESAMELSKQVNTLAGDLASFQNKSVEEASTALTKALLGETESAKMLGIVIRQDTKEFKDSVAEKMKSQNLTMMQAKAMTILEIATRQSKNAVGDYARTQDSLANRMKASAEAWKNLKVQMGDILIKFAPIKAGFTELTAILQEAPKFMERLANSFNYYLGVAAIELNMWAQKSNVLFNFVFVNLVSAGKWAFDNIGNFFNNFLTFIIAFSKDAVQIQQIIPQSLIKSFSIAWEAIKGIFKGDDLKSVMSEAVSSMGEELTKQIENIGLNTAKAMNDSGFSELKLTTFDDVFEKLSKINKEYEDLKDANFKLNAESAGKAEEVKKATPSAKTKETETKAQESKSLGARIETTVADAVVKGSLEALKLNNTVVQSDKAYRKQVEIAKSTKEIAKNTKSKPSKGLGGLAILNITG